MANRTIILNQEQLNEINGSNCEYLDAVGKDFNQSNANNEVYVGAKSTDTKNDAKPTTTDRFAKELGRADNWFTLSRARFMASPNYMCCSKRELVDKLLNESNSELEGMFFKLNPTIIKILKDAQLKTATSTVNAGKKRIQNILNNNGLTYTEATTILSKMDKMQPDTEEYLNLGGKPFHDFLRRLLDSKTSAIKQRKENLTNLGLPNQYQKRGGTKMSGNGKAHSPKGNITYFEN